MKVQFYLADAHSKNDTAIVANIHLQGIPFRKGIGVSVLPKYWNKKTHRVRQSPSYRQGSRINKRLDDVKSDIEGCYYDYLNKHKAEPSHATFKKLIDKALGKTKEVKLSFFEYFQDFINRTKLGQRQTAKGKIIKPYKHKTYLTTYRKLWDFDNKLTFDDINLSFYSDFLLYMRKHGYAENYIGTNIKNLKSVLNDATDSGNNTNLAFRDKKFTTLSEDVDNIALTPDELKAIEDLELKEKHLDRVRDLFLIACHTGLRFSDLNELTIKNLKEGFIEKLQSKTGDLVVIPVHEVVGRIIKKYNDNIPSGVKSQKFNKYLKEVCKQVPALKEPYSKTRTQGGIEVTTNYKKWEIITSHTGRRTFATNAYKDHIPTISIMAITGHKTEENFLKYIKVSPKEHAEIVKSYWEKKKNEG